MILRNLATSWKSMVIVIQALVIGFLLVIIWSGAQIEAQIEYERDQYKAEVEKTRAFISCTETLENYTFGSDTRAVVYVDDFKKCLN